MVGHALDDRPHGRSRDNIASGVRAGDGCLQGVSNGEGVGVEVIRQELASSAQHYRPVRVTGGCVALRVAE